MSVFKETKKYRIKISFILLFLFLALAIVFILRFIIGGTEDTWLCQNGVWVKHGNPSSPSPIGGCGESQIVGGDKDVHGCIGSAGYSWCEVKQKCLRVWEEPCVK